MNTIAQQISPGASDRLLTVLAEGEPGPQRIAVSCIDEIDDPFPPPRPFDCRSQRCDLQSAIIADQERWNHYRSNAFLEKAAARLRCIGYGLISASVLLLVFEGIFRGSIGI